MMDDDGSGFGSKSLFKETGSTDASHLALKAVNDKKKKPMVFAGLHDMMVCYGNGFCKQKKNRNDDNLYEV